MVAPLYVNTINPAIIADAIDLLVYDATHPEEMGERIEVAQSTPLTWQKIAFGNIAVHIASPEARLAALMALSDPLTLQGINPYFILRSYSAESFPHLLNTFKENLKGKEQQRRITELERLGPGVELADTYHLAEIVRKMQAHTPLDTSELAFLYEIDSQIQGFGYSRDPRIEELRSQRNAEEDMPIVFACERSQIAHNPSEIRPGTRAYVGPLEPGIFQRLTEAKVEHIYTAFPEGKIRRQAVEIGGKTREQLQAELQQAGVNISPYAQDMIRSHDFTTLPTAQMLDTVRLKVQDLGVCSYPTTDEVYKKAQELGLELCPAEVGPQYLLQYADQPLGEWFFVGMKQIATSHSSPGVFELGRGGAGLGLGGDWAGPTYSWGTDDEFVFSLRKSESQKSQTLSSFLKNLLKH